MIDGNITAPAMGKVGWIQEVVERLPNTPMQGGSPSPSGLGLVPSHRFSRSLFAMLAAVLAICLVGCSTSASSEHIVSTPQARVQPNSPPRPIVISPDTQVTVCRPIDTTAVDQQRRPPASVGFTARTCLGMPPNRSIGALVIVDIDDRNGRAPAWEAGLRLGDHIVAVNGCTGISELQLIARQGTFVPGNTVEITVARLINGRYWPVTALIPTEEAVAQQATPASCQRLGLRTVGR